MHVARSGRGVFVRGPPVAPEGRRVGASHEEARTRRRRLVGALLSLSLSLSGWGRVGDRDRARAMSAAQSAAHSIKWAPSDRALGRRVRMRARARPGAVANADAPPGECGRSAPRLPPGRAQSRIKSRPSFVLSENEIKIKINSNKNAVCVKCARSVSRSQNTLPWPAAGESPLCLPGRATRSPD